MNKQIAWQSIAVPLDISDIEGGSSYLRRWLDYERTEQGILFRCEMANSQSASFQVDLIQPDIVHVRMSQGGFQNGPGEMLAQGEGDWLAQPFKVEEQSEALVVHAGRLRLEFSRFPWQMRVFDTQSADQTTPFFAEQCYDRAYGPHFEVPPPGFDEDPDDGRLTARETVAVAPGEAFYGFGERFTPLEKWGQELVLWATDSGNVSSTRSYKNVPFLMSTAGYGLYVHSSQPMVFRMGSESSISYSFHVDDRQLDYFLIYGPGMKQILKRYAGLVGHAPVPPKWSFGFWVSRCGYMSRDEVETVVREMRERDLPLDVLSLDPWWMGDGPWTTYAWDTGAFPEPEKMMAGLRQRGVRTCLWINPYVPAGSPAYLEAEARGYLVSKPGGGISPVIEAFAGHNLAAIDFTNPEAVTWFQAKLRSLLEMGAAVFKSDFGEQAPVDAVYWDGRSGVEVHNIYPLLYNRAVFEATRETFGRGFTWARSAYAGSQRYPVQWGGDSYSTLDQMACQIRGLLGYGLSGVPFCSHDVGGFDYPPQSFDHSPYTEKWQLEEHTQDPVVYVRWLQFGVFSSHVRAHGKQPREPYAYGPQVEEIARRYLKLRYRLLPYIYSQAVHSARTGIPMARAMVLEYPEDPATYPVDLQYMFGDSFLVAPVVSRTNRCRVYLPAGEWVDYWSKEVVTGGRWIEVEAPLDLLPLWVRAGAIVPLGPDQAHTGEKALEPLTLEIYRPRGEVRTVIHDEDAPQIPVRYTRRGAELTVEIGACPGELEIVLYGERATAASVAGWPLPLDEALGGGQGVCLDGTRGAVVTFELEP
jgi:alpha-D-xyloside xylohydrolase